MNLNPSLITNQCTVCSPAYSSFSQKAILLADTLQNKNELQPAIQGSTRENNSTHIAPSAYATDKHHAKLH